jgi:site-specific DNA recombinase
VLREALFNARNAGIRQYRGREVTAGAWPAIVDRDVYEGARAILTDPARVHRRRHAHDPRFLLTGLALCGVCGKPLGSTTNHERPVYTCRHCQEVSRCVQAVDDWVIGKVVERLSQSDPPSR